MGRCCANRLSPKQENEPRHGLIYGKHGESQVVNHTVLANMFVGLHQICRKEDDSAGAKRQKDGLNHRSDWVGFNGYNHPRLMPACGECGSVAASAIRTKGLQGAGKEN